MKTYLLIAFVSLTSLSWAQDQNFSDATLQKFADAYTEVRNENMTLQLNMLTAIENAGLTSDEFTDIHTQLKNPNAEQPSSENKIKYDNALKNIEALNQDIQESIERIIMSKGLKVDTYQSIAKAYASNPALKERIQNLIN